LNPSTLELNNDAYFPIDRLIPEKQPLNVSKAAFTKTHIPVLRALKEDIIKHSFNQDTWTVSADNLTIMRIELNDNNNEPQDIYMNAKYFLHFVDFVVNAVQTDRIYVSYSSPIRPVGFSNDEFEYLITPIRKR
jgi:DNA polymerase III sliding clamp (beta) subunit (PCNA family)